MRGRGGTRAGPWRGPDPLLLASASAVRLDLLRSAGIEVEAVPSGIDERALERELPPGSGPDQVAVALARAKALAVSAERPGHVVVGADQVLACEAERFSKAASPDEAAEQLVRLAGRRHSLHSAVAVARGGVLVASFVDVAHLAMRRLGRPEIERYVAMAGAAATRSVGGYEVEGLGIHLFDRIEGQHSTILGLPLLPLLAAFRRLGLLTL